jgi:3-phenylpropionate/trans-cinnamate dioxygenase ferredoxin reductase subunit
MHMVTAMPERLGIVIVGAGLAGVEGAFALRECGYAGRIVVIGREQWPPYDRPPLSKAYLKGDLVRERLWLRPAELYAEQRIELLLGTEVTAIDGERRCVHLDTGAVLGYSKLLLTTGGEARRLTIPGSQLSGVCELKTLDDAERLAGYLAKRSSIVIIGGGYVGMEFAATARQADCEVTVVESQSMVLSRSLSPTIARYLQTEHERRGVRVLTRASVVRIEGDERVDAVVLEDGARLCADLVLVSVGNQANDGLACSGGILANRGILVDRDGRTSAPDVFAAGDCTASFRAGFNAPQRLESVQNATAQARQAAAAMSGQSTVPDEVPWFWSNQFDIKLQMAGLPLPGDTELVRGDAQSGRFSVIYQNADRMTAIHCVNAPGDFVAAKKMIAEGRIFPAASLCDPGVSLRDVRLSSLTADQTVK